MRIHFIGIGGIGISALAQYYLAIGHKVSGSDLVSSEITETLEKKGAKIFIGPHKARNLPKDVNLVVYSQAIPSTNPELKKAKKLQTTNYKLQIMSYPEALGELTKKYWTIAVSGTHGKGTTTAMISLILIKAGFNPTVILGTKLKEFGNNNFRLGGLPTSNIQHPTSNILVIEADEYRGAFLNYWPKIIVLTNIEEEHMDYFKDLNHILDTYRKYILHLPKDGVLVANKEDKNIQKMLISNVKYQMSKQIQNSNFKTIFYSLKQKEVKKIRKILRIPGNHMVSDALAALTVARILKIPDKISFKVLSEYKGAWRRFEIKKIKLQTTNYKLQTTLISDYAHHPTEIEVTLKAAREKFPKRKIWVIFQPHQYQRTYYLFDDFVRVFRKALCPETRPRVNKLVIIDIFDVAGREKKKTKKKVSSEKLVREIKRKAQRNKRQVIYIPTIKEAADFLKDNLQGEEVLIIMGAGDIYRIIDYLTR